MEQNLKSHLKRKYRIKERICGGMGEDNINKQLLMKIDMLNKRIMELEASETQRNKVENKLKEKEAYQKTIFSAIQTLF